MAKNKVWELITLEDILRLNTFDQQLYIHDPETGKNVPMLQTTRDFFTQIYAKACDNDISVYDNSTLVHRKVKINQWMNEVVQTSNSLVILIEGYAGCGKSTFVQYTLSNYLGTYHYDYNYYNYDIGAYYENIEGHRIRAAIRECFIKQLMFTIEKDKRKIIDKFVELLSQAEIGYLDGEYELYSKFLNPNTNTFQKAVQALIEQKDSKNFRFAMYNLLEKFSLEQIMILDFVFRIAVYIQSNKHNNSLIFIVYDNMDSIENYTDLENFHKVLELQRKKIDDYINKTIKLNFQDIPVPKFILMTTYRKITAAKVGLSKNSERVDDFAEYNRYIYHVDITHLYSYDKIISKRKEFYYNYARMHHYDGQKVKAQLSLAKELTKTEFVRNRYAGLWNNNYRTCSSILNRILNDYYGQAKQCLNLAKLNIDGYDPDRATYHGASAVFVSLVCKVFHNGGLWGAEHMNLITMSPNKDVTDRKISDLTSLSRLLLTYISNQYDDDHNLPVSTQEIFHEFGDLFSADEICKCLSNMLARDKSDTWRRPIYYYDNAIEDNIEETLKMQWELSTSRETYNYTQFLLCECGNAFVERLTLEFEFFSNRIANDNKSLYLLTDFKEIECIICNVYSSIEKSCIGMLQFCEIYKKKKGIKDNQQYVALPIHPRTEKGHPQIYTERIIFSHVEYLNRCRKYHLDRTESFEKKKQINKIFVDYMEKYLGLYMKYIAPIDSSRTKIAKDLLSIIDDIINAKDNEEILFQSVSSK